MLSPASEVELAALLADARGRAFRVMGGGTRMGAGLAGGAEELSVAGLSGVSLYEPGALTLVAAAGTPVADVEALLAGEGQMLAFEPMDHRVLLGTTGVPTLGGMAAGNVSGPRRIQSGACRDAMLGVRFVDGTGAVVRNGGRVMKNVTGYDLVKLMAGSFGTLGILTEIALKVLPRPEAGATVVLSGLDPQAAVAAMSAALASPFDVTGAAHAPGPVPQTWLRVEGFETSVAYRAGALRDRLARFGEIAVEADPERHAAIWRAVRDVTDFAGRPVVWRISVKPSDAPGLISELAGAHGSDVRLDWGGGLIWLAGEAEGAEHRHAGVQAAVARTGGHATLVKAPAAVRPVFQPPLPGVARLESGLRARFDPHGLFNPGLMGQAA